MLRAIRFACSTGFDIDDEIIKSISHKASHILYVSGERIKQEMPMTPEIEYIVSFVEGAKRGIIK